MRSFALAAERWTSYFEAFDLDGQEIAVSVRVLADAEGAGEPMSDSREPIGADWMLEGIGYDPDRDVFELAIGARGVRLPQVRYFVGAPRSILVAESWGATTLSITDANGLRTAIRLTAPIDLLEHSASRRFAHPAAARLH